MRRTVFVGTAARLLVVGLTALWLGLHPSPASWAINAYWFFLLLAVALVGGGAIGRPRAGVLAGEAVMTLAVLQGLWPVLGVVPSLDLDPFAPQTQGVGWRLSFTDQRQALAKVFDLPPGWDAVRVYLRVDLTNDYVGDAGFLVAVNGQGVGQLDRHAGKAVQVGVVAPHWALELPHSALSRAPFAEVTLTPTKIDPALSIPGHGDPNIEPLGKRNSRFYDGETWRTDRLAGPLFGPASGTYRMWLYFLTDP
jgi:hypothetical protein